MVATKNEVAKRVGRPHTSLEELKARYEISPDWVSVAQAARLRKAGMIDKKPAGKRRTSLDEVFARYKVNPLMVSYGFKKKLEDAGYIPRVDHRKPEPLDTKATYKEWLKGTTFGRTVLLRMVEDGFLVRIPGEKIPGQRGVPAMVYKPSPYGAKLKGIWNAQAAKAAKRPVATEKPEVVETVNEAPVETKAFRDMTDEEKKAFRLETLAKGRETLRQKRLAAALATPKPVEEPDSVTETIISVPVSEADEARLVKLREGAARARAAKAAKRLAAQRVESDFAEFDENKAKKRSEGDNDNTRNTGVAEMSESEVA